MYPIDRTPLSRYERVYSSVTSTPPMERRGAGAGESRVGTCQFEGGRGASTAPFDGRQAAPPPADRSSPLRYERVYSSSSAAHSAVSPSVDRRSGAGESRTGTASGAYESGRGGGAAPAPAVRTNVPAHGCPSDLSFPSRSLKDARSWIRDELARESGDTPMSTFNTNSSYSRTYEKKVVEETPRVRLSSPPTSHFTSGIPDHIFPSSFGSRLTGGLGDVSGFGGTFHSIKTTDDSISVQMDVKEYKPEELKVSVIGQTIVIEAKHGEKKDDFGSIERHFIRRIPLPKGVAPEAVTSTLTTEGALSIVALPPKPKDPSPPRTIPIKVQVAAAGDKA